MKTAGLAACRSSFSPLVSRSLALRARAPGGATPSPIVHYVRSASHSLGFRSR